MLLGEAEGVEAALIVDDAGNLAALLVTFFVVGAVAVFGALDAQAARLIVLRIAEETVLAAAHGFAVLDDASGVAAAKHGAGARILTRQLSVGALQARLVAGTVSVGTATCLLDAHAVDAEHRVGALAVAAAGRSAFSADALLRGQTIATGQTVGDAQTADARLRLGTLRLAGTEDDADTALRRIARETRAAGAGGAVVGRLAVAVQTARCRRVAGVDALVAQALLVGGAVLAVDAFERVAFDLGVARRLEGAPANGLVVLRQTLGVFAANVGLSARVFAQSGEAGSCGRTVRVGDALA